MRVNLPVTNVEREFREGEFIVSRTDLRGVITFVNPYFCEISGYSEKELLGQAHNIIRHPDMPPEAFADLWATLKKGRPWTGLVKNRCKNGDFYWTEANVTPLWEGEQMTGYMSVRTKPTRAQVEAATRLYEEMRAGKCKLRLEEGRLVRPGVERLLGPLKKLSIGQQLLLWLSIVAVPAAGLIWALGAGIWLPTDALSLSSAVAAVLALAGGVAFALWTSLVNPLRTASDHLEKIAGDDFRTRIETEKEDEIGTLLRAIKVLQIRLGNVLADARKRAEQGAMIKAALASSSASALLAGRDGQILYVNDALLAALKKHAEAIARERPGFDPARIVGMSLDALHPDFAAAVKKLDTFEGDQLKIVLGGRTCYCTLNPVIDEQGKRIGLFVDWWDITGEIKMQEEVHAVLDAALAGDFSPRLSLEGKSGFMQKLSTEINRLLSAFRESIEDFVRVMRQIAEGDLDIKLAKNYQGLFRELQQDINATVGRLAEVVDQIRHAADRVRSAAQEIARGNTDLASRVQEQASALEETSSSMEEMTDSVKHNADNAQQARQLATSAREKANAGGEVVTRAVAAMEQINAVAKRIAEIIGVIDEIAFQTNLLALNAAVEAARAGEQGRGFTVVAQEVRHLAQRSAQAAKQIKDLIKESIEKVETGSSFVNATGQALAEIVEAVKKVSDIVAEIAVMSREQASGIEQVNKAVMQMDEVTQQNAALVEEAAAAAKSMEDQAQALSDLVAFFRLDGRADVSVPPQAAPIAAAARAGERPRVGGERIVESAAVRMPPTPQAAPPKPAIRLAAASTGGHDDGEWEEF